MLAKRYVRIEIAPGPLKTHAISTTLVVMDGTLGSFFKPEKNLEFFRLKNEPRDAYPGKLE